jgi:hypothetical protein
VLDQQLIMQQIEHALKVRSVLFLNKESECRINDSDLIGDSMTPCTNTPISYWLVVQELLNSYNTAIPSFALQDVLTGAEVRETGIINEVN